MCRNWDNCNKELKLVTAQLKAKAKKTLTEN